MEQAFSNRIPILYINRDEDVERRAYMESQFEELGITNAVRFSAFTGDLLKADPGFRFEIKKIRENVMRAMASHLWAIQSLDFKDSEYALILEDDVDLTTCLNWSFTLEEFAQRLPEGWDAVQLYLNPNENKKAPITLNVRPYSRMYISTLAYLITKKGAEEICQNWFRVGVPDLTKAHLSRAGCLTDTVVYTPKSYGVNLVSTKEFVSTIIDKIPDSFHEHSRKIIRLWEEAPLALDELFTGAYTQTSN